jgi:hypothetical protein
MHRTAVYLRSGTGYGWSASRGARWLPDPPGDSRMDGWARVHLPGGTGAGPPGSLAGAAWAEV